MLGLRRLLVADLRCSSYLESMRQLRLAPGDFRWHCHCCQWLQGGTLWEVGTFINLYKWLTYIFERSCFLQLGSWHLLLDHLGPSFFPCQELRPQGPKAPKDRTVGMISHDQAWLWCMFRSFSSLQKKLTSNTFSQWFKPLNCDTERCRNGVLIANTAGMSTSVDLGKASMTWVLVVEAITKIWNFYIP